MAFSDFIISPRARRNWIELPYSLQQAVDHAIEEFALSNDPDVLSEQYNDGFASVRGFEVSTDDGSVLVGYNVDTTNNIMYVSSIGERETAVLDYELRFFQRDNEREPALERFLMEVRRNGEFNLKRVASLVRLVLRGEAKHPLIKSVENHPDLSEMRRIVKGLKYRVYYFQTARDNRQVFVLLGGIVKNKKQRENQDEVGRSYSRLQLVRDDVTGNPIGTDEADSEFVRRLIENIVELDR